MKQLHPIQLQILKKLLFVRSLQYSQLKPNRKMENNQFDFHLDQIIKANYVVKKNGQYVLTPIGKEYANRMDTKQTLIAKQAKVGTIVMPVRRKNKQTEYLIYTRLKQPFYGCQGFMSGKIGWGETVIETAQRELKEETSLNGKPQLAAIKHFKVYDRNTKELLEDKFLFYCIVRNPKGELRANKEGKFEWIKEKNLTTYVTNHFESMDRFKEDIALIQNFHGKIRFDEIDHLTSNF